MTTLAVIGTAALWLTFVWLASAIAASQFSDLKGYPEKWGLVTGTVLSVMGAFVWAVWPPREISRWKLHGGFSSTARNVLIVLELIVVVAAVYLVATIDASGPGRIGLVAVAIMVVTIIAALVYTIDIQRSTGDKTLAELRAERGVLD